MIKITERKQTTGLELYPGQKVSRKYRQQYLRKLRRKEYGKLQASVPAVALMEKVSKVCVIEEAIKHIDSLHRALSAKLRTTNPELQPTPEPTMKEVISHLVRPLIPMHLIREAPPMPSMEKQQKVATYLLKDKRNMMPRR